MAVAERIQKYVQRLPEGLQSEVLDFVEYLLSKAEREENKLEESDWQTMSLTQAMRGMEEEGAAYTTADLKESF